MPAITFASRHEESPTCSHAAGTAPFDYLPKPSLDRLRKINHFLIHAFQNSISVIQENLTGTYLFLLTDSNGVLLSMNYSSDLKAVVEDSPIRPGMFFTAQSCGVNAISVTMDSNEPVVLLPEQHESPYFQSWHCYAAPLFMGSQHVGYLDVSTINADMQGELIAIAKLIPAYMQNCYQSQQTAEVCDKPAVEFTERQLTILEMIAGGLTVKAIALKLKIKECTVNHHKKVIFNKLGVQSSTEAVSIASRMSYV
ncbi:MULTISPECIES: LuxR C-terminal-related transcriptional regulator [Paenibacillus]|uniref:LuxR C-terminal-related transcriptional regulator n=1 Tax=Paenibacillus TaxID=44249 RepID=UPI0003E2B468|nr:MULTISPECIES: LuxR C-terminal-related transcriptional regulator [Paenibacillus]ETT42004.1 LuxR family transcriptional regulator [Paenibacillus sp. FSL H7-689]MCP1422422.1 DNA-binding CsgD family transcriptional regulator [Paenibacillus xylanexedens]